MTPDEPWPWPFWTLVGPLSCRYDALPTSMACVKGREALVQSGLTAEPLLRLNKILAEEQQPAAWRQELTMSTLAGISSLLSPSGGDAAALPPLSCFPPQPPRPSSLRPSPMQATRHLSNCPASSSRTSGVRADFALVLKTPETGQGSVSGKADAASSSAAPASKASSWLQAVQPVQIVGEAKHFGKLDADGQPPDLIPIFTQPESEASDEGRMRQSVHRILDQLFTYMVLTGVEFGWLSSFYYTWLAWRPLDNPDCLRLSRPFLHCTSGVDRGVPAMAALSWLQDEGMTRTHYKGFRHAPPHTATSDGGEEQGYRQPPDESPPDDEANDDGSDYEEEKGRGEKR